MVIKSPIKRPWRLGKTNAPRVPRSFLLRMLWLGVDGRVTLLHQLVQRVRREVQGLHPIGASAKGSNEDVLSSTKILCHKKGDILDMVGL